jgi:23S rRNA (guanosine2251-2'-O)-methyltransferase
MKIFVILHNIRSAHNVGSIFRTADGAGVAKIFLCGYTPTPIDRFGRPVTEIQKTSLGATESVFWEHVEKTEDCITTLKESGVHIVAVEQLIHSIPYGEWTNRGDTAFIFGNEIDGVPVDICDMADTVIHIPMHGMKESLNVGVSVGVVLFNARSTDAVVSSKKFVEI